MPLYYNHGDLFDRVGDRFQGVLSFLSELLSMSDLVVKRFLGAYQAPKLNSAHCTGVMALSSVYDFLMRILAILLSSFWPMISPRNTRRCQAARCIYKSSSARLPIYNHHNRLRNNRTGGVDVLQWRLRLGTHVVRDKTALKS